MNMVPAHEEFMKRLNTLCETERESRFQMANIKFGWNPTPHDAPRLFLKDYMRKSPKDIAVPVTFDFSTPVPSFPMLDNDRLGDCVEAACYHANQVFTDNTFQPTNAEADALYTAVTGYNPNDPNSDQGTVIKDALDWWMHNPLPGDSSPINAYFSVDVNDVNEINTALWMSGSLLIGFDVPYSAVQQFNAGKIWDVVPGSPIVGGHCINLTGIDGTVRNGISWAARQGMTAKFWNKYVSEAWMVADENWIASTGGKAANLLDWHTLNTDIQAMFPGTTGPYTDPGTGPTPAPNPTPAPSGAVELLSQIQTEVNSYFSLTTR